MDNNVIYYKPSFVEGKQAGFGLLLPNEYARLSVHIMCFSYHTHKDCL